MREKIIAVLEQLKTDIETKPDSRPTRIYNRQDGHLTEEMRKKLKDIPVMVDWLKRSVELV